MRLPEIRTRLEYKAIEHGDPELWDLAQAMRRRKPLKIAPVSSLPVTKEVRVEVKIMRAENPRMALDQIGRAVGVNQGRVSEILRGKRK